MMNLRKRKTFYDIPFILSGYPNVIVATSITSIDNFKISTISFNWYTVVPKANSKTM